ncbi:MAG: hypothetical protein J3R72DRAFT_494958 [Linnemannia gamsii]|nr:MAG: hypothetical protein J3R72DRAFT_494958 [Linnemannia gamsii]
MPLVRGQDTLGATRGQSTFLKAPSTSPMPLSQTKVPVAWKDAVAYVPDLCLYVDEEISVNRQLMRGKLTKDHNAQVMRSGKGNVMEEGVTDVELQLLNEYFLATILDLINAVGSIESVMRIILKEFEYQSSLGLEHDTYKAISHIPLATMFGTHAHEVSPMIAHHAIRGQPLARSDNTILSDSKIVEVVFNLMFLLGCLSEPDLSILTTQGDTSAGKIPKVQLMANLHISQVRRLEEPLDCYLVVLWYTMAP